jgi:Fic family protein
MISKLLDSSWFGVLNTSKWAKITKCSADTALRDISDLVEKNILEKDSSSGGRSTNYKIKCKGR